MAEEHQDPEPVAESPPRASFEEETPSAPISDARYLVQGNIGHGGMGQIYRAWDQNLGRHVAIKRISDDADVDAAIRREAGILATLHHPNIVTIFDFAADETGPFVVMELVEGRNLDDVVMGQPLDVPAFLELVNQVCRGLSSAHAAGLLHLDIKAGNIMLQLHRDGSFTSKILDFGLARARGEGDTEAGEIMASPYTVSPEQLTRQPVDARSDLYSLGCVFYFALSGKNPFEAPTISDILQRHLQGETTALHLIAPKVPQAMSRVIASMIDRDPARRPQSAEEVRQQLFKSSRAPAPSQAVAPPAQRPGAGPAEAGTPATPGRKSGGIFVVLALLVLAGGGVWWYIAQQQARKQNQAAPALAEETPAAETAPVLNPADAAAVEQNMGATVTVEGTVESVAESQLFHANFLKLSGVPDGGVVISLRTDVVSAEQARTFVGKRVRATGQLSGAAGTNRVVVESPGDLKVTGP